MWIEVARYGFIGIGGAVALALGLGPRIAERLYVRALLSRPAPSHDAADQARVRGN